MRSTIDVLTQLQKEMILYSINLEKAVDLEDKPSVLYYDVLLEFTMKQIEQIYRKFVEEERQVITPFCHQIAKGLLEREAHLQKEDYYSFLNLFINELCSKYGISNYKMILDEEDNFGHVTNEQEQYQIYLPKKHLKDINIRFNLETIFLMVLKMRQCELKKHTCNHCYTVLKKEKINTIKNHFPYLLYDFDFYEDSSLELYMNLEFFLFVDSISLTKRKELEREMKRKMEKSKWKLTESHFKNFTSSFQFNSYDLLFEEEIVNHPEFLEKEIFQLEYQLKGKRRTLLDIFLSRSKLQKLLEHKNMKQEELDKAKAKIEIYDDFIFKSDYPFQQVGDVILFLFTSFLLDKDKRIDDSIFGLLLMKYQHMIAIEWHRAQEEYVTYRNLLKEIENKLSLQMRKNKQLALKNYDRYMENEKQFQNHMEYFQIFQDEMEPYFELLNQVVTL
ncbi:MAG: hypothetical protein KH135_05005 [Firmicutes bacterium]|nr:hypothetical protein [Bacillota bacterium]